jgi:hypothetical protein
LSSLQLYTLIFFVGDGTLLAEEQQVDVRRTSGSQRVLTVAKGFAGVSPGAGLVEIDVTNAIPSGGFEFNMGQKIMGLIPLDVQVIGPGGKSLRSKAFVEHDTIKHGVNQDASYMFSCVMPITDFL